MPDLIIYAVLFIFLIAIAALAHKYHIDTKSTIEELSKERKLYQRMAWQEIEARESFLKQQSSFLAEQESRLKVLVAQALEFKDYVEKNKAIDDKTKRLMLKKLEFVDAYESLAKKKSKKHFEMEVPQESKEGFSK